MYEEQCGDIHTDIMMISKIYFHILLIVGVVFKKVLVGVCSMYLKKIRFSSLCCLHE